MEELLNYLLTEITGNEIAITQKEEDGRTVFEISPDEATIGLVIGKNGKTIKAIQEVLRVRARKENKFIYLRVTEQEKQEA